MNNYKNAELFFQNNGISYKVASGGQELIIACPFCGKEKCYVESATGLFYCFGGDCGQGGNWKGLAERLGQPDAIIPEQPAEEKEIEQDLPPIDPLLVEENSKRLSSDLCRIVREQYIYEKRGYTDETLSNFKLGWDGRNVTIPIFDSNGDCMNFKLKPDPTRPIPAKGMYSILGRGRKRLFNEIVLKSNPESIIICEGEWDCMMLAQHGYTSVTSTAGANSFDKSWVSAFANVEKVFVCFDNDSSGIGQKAAQKTAQLFYEQGITVYVVTLPDPDGVEQKMDVTDFFKKKGAKANDSFNKLLIKAKAYQPEENKEDEEKISFTKILLDLIFQGGCQVNINQDKEPIITFPETPLVAYPIDGIELKRWLSGRLYELCGEGITDTIFSKLVSILEGKASYEGNVITLHNRIARIDNTIYYDLGNGKSVVRIDKNGFTISKDCPIKFKRFMHQVEQVEPLQGGKLEKILQYINIKDEQNKLLFLTYLVTVFVPDIPRVVLVHVGDQGSAKSTGMRIARSIIDPSSADLLIPPTDVAEMAQAANHHYCLYLDNLSGLSDTLSDVLCRLVTGVGFTKRKLFTNSGDILFNQIVAIGITGITLVATKPDLLDRCLILQFQRITDEQREDEDTIWNNFETDKPYILGAIFSHLSNVLKLAPELTFNKRPRMAAYARYATAAAISLGKSKEEFLTAFSKNVQRQNYAAIESSPTAQVIIDFMFDKETWEGSTSELHKLLKILAENANLQIGYKGGFPKSSNKLWNSIKQVRPNLISLGIIAEHKRSSSSAIISLIKNKNGDFNSIATEDESLEIKQQLENHLDIPDVSMQAVQVDNKPLEEKVSN